MNHCSYFFGSVLEFFFFQEFFTLVSPRLVDRCDREGERETGGRRGDREERERGRGGEERGREREREIEKTR